MSKLPLSVLLLAIPLSAAAAPDVYTVDPFHTFPNFSVDHLGISTIHGRFGRTTGKFAIDRAAKTGSVDVVVDAASVDTGDADKGTRPRSRDEHLRSSDFFNVAEFAKITYKSTRVTFDGDNPKTIEGELTMLGVTKPLALTVERFKCNDAAPPARQRCGGNATGRLKRSEWGVKAGIPAVGDEVALTITLEGLKNLD